MRGVSPPRPLSVVPLVTAETLAMSAAMAMPSRAFAQGLLKQFPLEGLKFQPYTRTLDLSLSSSIASAWLLGMGAKHERGTTFGFPGLRVRLSVRGGGRRLLVWSFPDATPLAQYSLSAYAAHLLYSAAVFVAERDPDGTPRVSEGYQKLLDEQGKTRHQRLALRAVQRTHSERALRSLEWSHRDELMRYYLRAMKPAERAAFAELFQERFRLSLRGTTDPTYGQHPVAPVVALFDTTSPARTLTSVRLWGAPLQAKPHVVRIDYQCVRASIADYKLRVFEPEGAADANAIGAAAGTVHVERVEHGQAAANLHGYRTRVDVRALQSAPGSLGWALAVRAVIRMARAHHAHHVSFDPRAESVPSSLRSLSERGWVRVLDEQPWSWRVAVEDGTQIDTTTGRG